MTNVTPCLWFEQEMGRAVEFYIATFPNSRVLRTTTYGENMPQPAGTPLTIDFELNGTKFLALNGGKNDSFNNAVSFIVHCEDQAEVDHYWKAFLGSGGAEIACGWIKDGFGVRWQVVPRRFFELVSGPDVAQTQRVMQAMMRMSKMVIAELEAAAQG